VGSDSRPVANPMIELREETDDWAILFDPDTEKAFGINPVSVYVWKRLDGRHTPVDILTELKKDYSDVPDDALEHIEEFLGTLAEKGYIVTEAGM
jgi:SynChlorMet cassette protein ScmD